MAFKAKDGRQFGNRQQQRAYDERSGSNTSKSHSEQMQDEQNEAAGGEEMEATAAPIEEHVAEHGPAQKVEIHHGEGKHTKVSHHGGAKHVSHHDSAEEAHHAGMQAAGVGHEEPDGDEAAPAMAAGGDGAGAIPGM